MADQQITDLPVATEADDSDLLLMRQGSTDKQIAKSVLFAESLSTLENLNDVVNKATARSNLDVPQTATVLLKANNLSDLPNAATARDNLGVEIGVDVQGYSTQLAAVSANNTTTGFHVQTGTDTVASRTIVASSSKILVVNGSGAAGNPGIDVQEANLNMNNTGTVLAVPKGGTGVSSLTAYGLVAGGTTTTGNAQVISPATAGKILRGGGAAALPVFDGGILPLGLYRTGVVDSEFSLLVSRLPLMAPEQPHATLRFAFPATTTAALKYFPLFIPYDVTLTTSNFWQFHGIAGDSGKTITFGLYNDSGTGDGPSGSPIANTTKTGTFGAGATSDQLHFSTSISLTAGLYWAAVTSNTAGVANLVGYKNRNLLSFGGGSNYGSRDNYMVVGWQQNFTYSTTLPTPSGLSRINAICDETATPAVPVIQIG